MDKGTLSDVDGTLWDSAVQATESWNEVPTHCPRSGVGITTQDTYDNMGRIMMDIGKTLFLGLVQEECRKVTEECTTYENYYLLTHPGAPHSEVGGIVARLSHQCGPYIVSNCRSGYIEVLLKSCGLREYVRDIKCYGSIDLPRGGNIRMVVRRNHLERCFYVDDTHMDEEAAGVAGIPFVHASYGFGRTKRSVGTIGSLSKLPALAKKLLDQKQDVGQEKCKEIKQMLELFSNESLERILMDNPVDSNIISRSRIRSLLMKGGLVFQAEEQAGKQALRRNLDKDEAAGYVTGSLEGSFRQAGIISGLGKTLILISKKGRVIVRVKRHPEFVGTQPAGEPDSPGSLSHNRRKHYILEEGTPVPFLVDLGVMTEEGRMVNSHYDKYRQINRFLEFIEDVLPDLDQGRESAIIDFGCSKSYLTFAMYYYLKELEGYPVRIIGLNLKEDIVEHCNRLGRQRGHGGLSFCHGGIASLEDVERVDVVVTLHVCDLATDYALEKAVNWGVRVILSASCCQYELNGQMENSPLGPILRYDPIKERMAALYTDAVRAQVLEYRGYRTRILELVGTEHAPRNILTRAMHQGRERDNGLRVREPAEFLHVGSMVVELLTSGFWEPREEVTDI